MVVFFNVLICLVNGNVHLVDVQEIQCYFIEQVSVSVSGPRQKKPLISTRTQIRQRLKQPNFEERLNYIWGFVLHVLFESA